MKGPSAVHHLWDLTQARCVNCLLPPQFSRHSFFISNFDVIHHWPRRVPRRFPGCQPKIGGLLPSIWYDSERLIISALSIVLNSSFSVHTEVLTRYDLYD